MEKSADRRFRSDAAGAAKKKAPEIVATVGPASFGSAEKLHEAGATVFRLNSSHLSLEDLAGQTAAICSALPECPVVVDLQGAKMRIGPISERRVRTGERFRFALFPAGDDIPLPHRELYAAVAAGDTLECDDGRLRFKVIRRSDEAIEVSSLLDGTLRPRKGVNAVEHPVLLDDLSEQDKACVEATAGLGSVGFAFSFMRDGRETDWVRRRAPACVVAGKIERREAVQNIHRIAAAADMVWICRGDLGVQLGLAAMADWISAYDPRPEPCPVFMAGQVLDHLTAHASPTRSEVCHLFDLVKRGYAGFVLSDETAIGGDPVGAVRNLRFLLDEFSALLV